MEPAASRSRSRPLHRRESRRGNPTCSPLASNCVVYPLKGLWSYRIAEPDTNQGAYSRRRFPTQISAQLAAEEALGDFERDPRVLGVGPAPSRSLRGTPSCLPQIGQKDGGSDAPAGYQITGAG